MFYKRNVNVNVLFVKVSLIHREITTVKAVTLYKKLFFFSLKDLKARK